MKKRNINPKVTNDAIRRERDPIPWRYCLLTLVCGLLLVVGFFWAARQHFSAMDLGIKNAKLRAEKEELEADARRLYLLKEISLSPEEIKKAAKKIGLQELTTQSIEIITQNTDKNEKNLNETPKQAALTKNKSEKTNLPKKSDFPVVEVEKAKVTKTGAEIPTNVNSKTQIAKK